MRPVKLRFFNTSSYPKRSQKELKLIDKNPFGDTDRDSVPNFFDCKPLNRKKQGKFSQSRKPRYIKGKFFADVGGHKTIGNASNIDDYYKKKYGATMVIETRNFGTTKDGVSGQVKDFMLDYPDPTPEEKSAEEQERKEEAKLRIEKNVTLRGSIREKARTNESFSDEEREFIRKDIEDDKKEKEQLKFIEVKDEV